MKYRYQLEQKRPYIVKTELIKNRTHQTFRWVGIALSDDKEELKKYLNENRRIVDFEGVEE